jgi:hypothetical protein
MGARQYFSLLGRFLEVDPVPGGVVNDYIYPPDPVNSNDLDGLRRRSPRPRGEARRRRTRRNDDLQFSVPYAQTSFCGNRGCTKYHIVPSGRALWGIDVPARGRFQVAVYVNGVKYDGKTDYIKGHVHASVNPKMISPGDVISLSATFVGKCWYVFTYAAQSGPNHYVVPRLSS